MRLIRRDSQTWELTLVASQKCEATVDFTTARLTSNKTSNTKEPTNGIKNSIFNYIALSQHSAGVPLVSVSAVISLLSNFFICQLRKWRIYETPYLVCILCCSTVVAQAEYDYFHTQMNTFLSWKGYLILSMFSNFPIYSHNKPIVGMESARAINQQRLLYSPSPGRETDVGGCDFRERERNCAKTCRVVILLQHAIIS